MRMANAAKVKYRRPLFRWRAKPGASGVMMDESLSQFHRIARIVNTAPPAQGGSRTSGGPRRLSTYASWMLRSSKRRKWTAITVLILGFVIAYGGWWYFGSNRADVEAGLNSRTATSEQLAITEQAPPQLVANPRKLPNETSRDGASDRDESLLTVEALRRALDRERDRSTRLAEALDQEKEQSAAAKQARSAEVALLKGETAVDLKAARQGQRDESHKANELGKEIATVRGEAEELRAALRNAAEETARAKEAGDEAASELRKDMFQLQARTEAQAAELASARSKIESEAATRRAYEITQNERLVHMKQSLDAAEATTARAREASEAERARSRILEEQSIAAQESHTQREKETREAAPPMVIEGPTPQLESTPPAKPSDSGRADSVTGAPVPASPSIARMLGRASELIGQGNIVAARSILESLAASGNARALFALAETYDPSVLAAWRTLGTKGDGAKALSFYEQALAGGISEAKKRLDNLRP